MNKNKNVTIALIANRALRMGPGSPLIRFVREFEPFFLEVLKPMIYTIEGSYRALIRSGLLHNYPKLKIVGAGQLGGLVSITEKVVRGEIDHVIYFIDPRDPTSLFPESIALKRECVVKKKSFLATYSGAREWASLGWFLKKNRLDEYFLSEKFVSKFLQKERKVDLIRNQTIALIAHNAKKLEMLKFANKNYALFKSFENRSATGTTGELLNGKIPKKMEEQWNDLHQEIDLYPKPSPDRLKKEEEEEAEIRAEVKRLASKLDGEKWVDPLESGPVGGDVQIAEKIRKKECHRVFFFEDPRVSREHEADIQLLERTARIPENAMSIPCLHEETSAQEWVDSVSEYNKRKNDKFTSPLTLVEAYRRCFNVELVLASRKGGKDQDKGGAATKVSAKSNDKLWDTILSKAAWYIQGLIALRSREQQATRSPARIGMTWGYSMYQLIDHIKELSKTLQGIEKSRKFSKAMATALSDEEFIKPGNVLVEPIVGIMGTTDLRVEANNNAARLARLLSAKEHPLTQCVFLERGKLDKEALQEMQKDQSDRWDRLDAAIFTCDAVKTMFGTKATAMVPDPLYKQMFHKVAGEIGGLYLDAAGNWVKPNKYERVGITHEQLQAVAKKGGAVLIAGVQMKEPNDRRAPVLAALRGKLVSVFVTDFDFALAVLRAHSDVRANIRPRPNRSASAV